MKPRHSRKCCLLLITLIGLSPLSIAALDNLWQGATVTAASPLIFSAPLAEAEEMFGAVYGGTEPGNTLFADGYDAGTVHWVEFNTDQAITLDAIRLQAAHDYLYSTYYLRSINHMTLLAKSDGSATYDQVLVDMDITVPYGDQPGNMLTEYNLLDLQIDLAAQTTARYFRVEFTQAGGTAWGGPRIQELIAIPEPATIGLLLAGAVLLRKK